MAKISTLFGINLRSAILRKGISFQRAADDIGVTRGFLYMLMSGDKEPGPTTLANICSVLGVSRADLYEEELREKTVGELSLEELSKALGEKLAPDESELLALYRKADNIRRQNILDIARAPIPTAASPKRMRRSRG